MFMVTLSVEQMAVRINNKKMVYTFSGESIKFGLMLDGTITKNIIVSRQICPVIDTIYCKFINFHEVFIFAKLRSFVKIKSSRNGENTLSFTDIENHALVAKRKYVF